jgi:glutamate decarboxylase
MPTYTLNFSRGSSPIIGQYYNFLRLGKEGYQQVMENCIKNAKHLSKGIGDFNLFKLLHESETVPIVVFKLKTQVVCKTSSRV